MSGTFKRAKTRLGLVLSLGQTAKNLGPSLLIFGIMLMALAVGGDLSWAAGPDKGGPTPEAAPASPGPKDEEKAAPAPPWLKIVQTGGPTEVSQAFKKDFKLETIEPDGLTPLMIAAAANPNPLVIKVLIDAGSDPEAMETRFGYNALRLAALFNANPSVALALVTGPDSINARDFSGNTAVTLAATRNPNPLMIQTLVKAGGDLTLKDDQGLSSLTLAALRNPSLAVIQKIISLGAEIDQVCPEGETALIKMARTGSSLEVFSELIKAGAKLEARSKNGETPFLAASQNPNENFQKILLAAGADPKALDNSGNNALFGAALTNTNPEVLKNLLRLGLDINHQNSLGLTPLMTAVANPDPEITRLLIIQGADPNIKNNSGRDALMVAARVSGEPMVIKTLLAAGAKPNVKDKNGLNALEIAEQNPAREIVALLKDWAANQKDPKQSKTPPKSSPTNGAKP
ncbi:MAG: ankyrin repeat domain-containing protein [Deltaproteobacteria bacterium]|jgi:ankyrin repeat protein|nr:ankyrin repeat domain-containing protein [Deltaproteobacteria bacterium]